jgi:hypothetical protein
VEEPTPTEIPSSKSRILKGKNLVFSPSVATDKVKLSRPFTRSTTRNHVPLKDDTTETSAQQKDKFHYSKNPIEVIDINTPHHESNPTFKRLRRQLKEARDEIDNLKKEYLGSRIKIKNMLDTSVEIIDKARFLAKCFFPLHRKLDNFYR